MRSKGSLGGAGGEGVVEMWSGRSSSSATVVSPSTSTGYSMTDSSSAVSAMTSVGGGDDSGTSMAASTMGVVWTTSPSSSAISTSRTDSDSSAASTASSMIEDSMRGDDSTVSTSSTISSSSSNRRSPASTPPDFFIDPRSTLLSTGATLIDLVDPKKSLISCPVNFTLPLPISSSSALSNHAGASGTFITGEVESGFEVGMKGSNSIPEMMTLRPIERPPGDDTSSCGSGGEGKGDSSRERGRLGVSEEVSRR